MTPRKERYLIALPCILGVLCVALGMALRNHPVFSLGLSLVVVGYLLVRRKLKRDSGAFRKSV